MRKSPEGTAERWYETVHLQPSLRDSNSIDHNPGVETPGYYRDVPPGHISIEFPKGIKVSRKLPLIDQIPYFSPLTISEQVRHPWLLTIEIPPPPVSCGRRACRRQ